MRTPDQVLLANTFADWLGAAGIALGTLVAFWILKRTVIRKLAAYARTTPTPVDDFVVATFAATRLLLLVPLALSPPRRYSRCRRAPSTSSAS